LRFGEDTIKKSAKKLTELCSDLWPNVDIIPNNKFYDDLLAAKKIQALKDLKKHNADKLASIKKDIANSKIELAAFTWLIKHNISIDNCIYYDHTGRFAFGWHKKLTDEEKFELEESLCEFPYDYNLK
jgi:hypothetical protein